MATRRSDDDSVEEEATAIDLRSSSQAFKKPGAPKSIAGGPPPKSIASGSASSKIADPKTLPPSSKSVQRSRSTQAPLHKSDDESDEEATEFLAARPPSAGASDDVSGANGASNGTASLRARGRAVPLEGDAGVSGEKPPITGSHRAMAAPPPSKAAMDQLPTTSPEMAMPLPLPKAPRPLPERVTNLKSESNEGSQTGPVGTGAAKSTPRITRIFVDPDSTPHKRIGDDDATSRTDPGAGDDNDNTDPPGVVAAVKHRPLPAPGKPPTINDERRRPKTRKTSAEPSSETLEADPADGTLIVEVPDGAVVFIDGIERGKGPTLKLKDIDRYAKHAVRIHCAGYLPWSGSVCLEGRTAAKIRPSLKKRT